MRWRALWLGGLLVATCTEATDPVTATVAELNQLTAAATTEQQRLARDLAARDDLGPGEYRDRLRAAYAEAMRALALEHEAHAAELLARAARTLAKEGPADRRALAAGMPPALAGLADLPPAGRARAAAQRARAARDRSRDYRARATDAAGEVRELRQRVVELLRRIAQVRLAIARQAASLRTSSQLETVDLLPAAKARRVRLTGVRLVGQVRERDLARETRILQAEGPLDAVGAWVGDLADRPGVATEGLEVRGVGTLARVTLRHVSHRLLQEEKLLPELPASSTPSILMLRLQDLEGLRDGLARFVQARPSPAPLLAAVAVSLPPAARLRHLSVSDDGFELLVVAAAPVAARFLEVLGSQPGIEVLRPAQSGNRLAVRGQWRPEPAVAAPPAPPHRSRRATPPPPPSSQPHPIEAFKLAGVVSAGKGTARALLRDPEGRALIVKVGSQIIAGVQVAEIGKDYVIARAGDRLVRIRAQ